MKKLHILLCLLLCLCSLTGCDMKGSSDDDITTYNDIKIMDVHFDENFKNFYVRAQMPDTLSYISLTNNPDIKIKTNESVEDNKLFSNNIQPRLTGIKNIRKEELAKSDYKLLILADLNLPDADFKMQRELVDETRKWFAPQNVSIAFMAAGQVSPSFPISDYVMNHYLNEPVHEGRIKLYRAILQKYNELKANSTNGGLLVISNGDVYGADNTPNDPDHFQLQEQLLNIKNTKSPHVFYANCGRTYEDKEYNEAQGVVSKLCENTAGKYYDKFSGKNMLSELTRTVNENTADYLFTFTNPDNKVYNGKRLHLDIDVYSNDTLLTHGISNYVYGNEIDPIIVNGRPRNVIIIQGILMTALFMALAYLILQFLVPYIRYRIFLHKYVIEFTKPSVMHRGIQVGEVCYFCKAPFIYGEKVVVKCKHVMHKDCWDENGYHCPEHGKHCPDGSHYYNHNDLLDRRNAPFYSKWIYFAVPATLICWIWFLVESPNLTNDILGSIVCAVHDVETETIEAKRLYDNYANHLYKLPVIGCMLNLMLALSLSWIAHNNLSLKQRVKFVAAKAALAGFAGYAIFMLGCIIGVILDLNIEIIFVLWIPWVANTLALIYIIAYNTRIVIRKHYIIAALVISICNTIIWSAVSAYTTIDMRVTLLLFNYLYSVCIALSLAFMAPRAERIFLHVEGAIKAMDIALYKWLNTSANYHVTIGRSVDCNLQLSWDLKNDIAPIQAEICYEKGRLCLHPLEDGVMVKGKPLKPDSYYRLIHGRKFSIGQTYFTYEEKDI